MRLRKNNVNARQMILIAALWLIPLSLCVGSSSCKAQASSAQGLAKSSPIKLMIGTKATQAIPATFMGIAHEWGDAQALMGSSNVGVDVIYRNLVNNLTAYGAGPIIIRIGGNSSDTSKVPTENTVRPFAELAAATGAHFYLGVNLGSGDPQLAVSQVKFFVSKMPPHSLDAIEIGNEPDSYLDKGLRKAPYDFQDYLREFDSYRQQISPLLPAGTGVLGPSWAFPASLSDAGPFLQSEHSYLIALSQHVYIGDACGGHTNVIDKLLAARSTTDVPARMRAAILLAHEKHVAFRVDELNSIACGGEDGVSNVFASALWAIDMMFEMVNAGVDGVNWQSPNGAAYSPVKLGTAHDGSRGAYWIESVNPLYYGMLFFQAATARDAKLVPVVADRPTALKTWATVDGQGTLRVVVINKSMTPATVALNLPGSKRATVLRLTAPSIASKTSVHFGGQTLDGSSDGRFPDAAQPEIVNWGGETSGISVAGGSALIITLNR